MNEKMSNPGGMEVIQPLESCESSDSPKKVSKYLFRTDYT